jgi:hypothetical protein
MQPLLDRATSFELREALAGGKPQLSLLALRRLARGNRLAVADSEIIALSFGMRLAALHLKK